MPASYTITFKKDGFADKTVVLRSSMDGWYFGNIAIGGPIGMVFVDPATGAMWRLSESRTVNLEQTTAASNKDRSLKIISVDELSLAQRQLLIRMN